MVHFVRSRPSGLLISGFHKLPDFSHLGIEPRVSFFIFYLMLTYLKVTDELILDYYSEYRRISNLFETMKCHRRLVISTRAKWYRSCLKDFKCWRLAASS